MKDHGKSFFGIELIAVFYCKGIFSGIGMIFILVGYFYCTGMMIPKWKEIFDGIDRVVFYGMEISIGKEKI